MKSSICMFGGLLTLLIIAGPASAAVTLDFGTGDAGAGGIITVLTSSTGSGSGIAIDTLTVTGGSPSINGTYDVDGTVNGSGETGVGSLDYNTATNLFTITGSISCDSTTTGGACAGKTSGTVLVASTTLLLGTGTLSLTNNIGFPISGDETTTFTGGTDDKASTLLTALGLTCTADPANTGFCSSWNYGGFSVGGAPVSGNTYTAFSTDIPNGFSGIPEPSSVLLLGSVLFGVTGLIRRRISKA